MDRKNLHLVIISPERTLFDDFTGAYSLRWFCQLGGATW